LYGLPRAVGAASVPGGGRAGRSGRPMSYASSSCASASGSWVSAGTSPLAGVKVMPLSSSLFFNVSASMNHGNSAQ